MDRSRFVRELAPCGLNCIRCARFDDGQVKHSSSELLTALEGFDLVAERFTSFDESFKHYQEFNNILEFFVAADCKGCRHGADCGIPGCSAKECHIQKGVDFCFECAEYPCTRNNYNPILETTWLTINNRIKDIGLDAYYVEQARQPRYKSYIAPPAD